MLDMDTALPSLDKIVFTALFPLCIGGVGCGGFFGADFVSAVSIGGQDRYYSADAFKDGGEEGVAREQASREFQCPTSSLAVAQPYKRAFVVTGCGKRGVFVTLGTMDWNARRIPGRDDDAYITYWRAVDVVAPVPPPSLPVEAANPIETLKPWIRLSEQGSKDLDCPIDQVTPDIAPQGRAPSVPLVEGCGRRAVYLGGSDPDLRLVSIVPIK